MRNVAYLKKLTNDGDLPADDRGKESCAIDIEMQRWFQRPEKHPGGRVWVSPTLQGRKSDDISC